MEWRESPEIDFFEDRSRIADLAREKFTRRGDRFR